MKPRVRMAWLALLGVIACGTRKTESVKMPASGTMMAGDSMAMMATALVPRVRANLDSLKSATPAVRDSALSHHAAVLDRLLRAMRTDLMHLGYIATRPIWCWPIRPSAEPRRSGRLPRRISCTGRPSSSAGSSGCTASWRPGECTDTDGAMAQP